MTASFRTLLLAAKLASLSILVAGAGCTSSSTAPNAGAGPEQPDREAATSSAETQIAEGATSAPREQLTSILQLSLETGDVYPGTDNYVYILPFISEKLSSEIRSEGGEEAGPEYYWSVSSGEISEVPESEQGRLQALVDSELSSALSSAAAPAPEAEATAGAEPQVEAPSADPSDNTAARQGAEDANTRLSADSQGKVRERRIVAGPEHIVQPEDGEERADPRNWSDEPFCVPAEVTQDLELEGGATAEMQAEPIDDPEAVESAHQLNPSIEGRMADNNRIMSKSVRSLRDQFQDHTGRSPLQLGSDAEEAKDSSDQSLSAADSFAQVTLVTKDPFIRWTPAASGKASIFVKIVWKEVDQTEVTELPVEVREREPSINLSMDFPDILHEDDSLYVHIDGENLPAFYKGLFTVSFDPDVLSFREAELGELFDDSSGASLYFAQPNKLLGTAIVAIDSSSQLSGPSGSGPIAYLKFKLKRNISSHEDTALALVYDTAGQYVLDHDGSNILPLPVVHPVIATSLKLPALGQHIPEQPPVSAPSADSPNVTAAAKGPGAVESEVRTSPEPVTAPVAGLGAQQPEPAAEFVGPLPPAKGKENDSAK